MKTVSLNYSRSQINKAGNIIKTLDIEQDDFLCALRVLGNWRAVHNYPINTFQATLRNRLKRVDGKALVAQRLKRTPSIIQKLHRFPEMNLARMQDIGGLRAVVSGIPQVNDIYNIYKKARFQHKLVSERNYIDKPKDSGYRSIHLVYRYNNLNVKQYNGLLIELQLRTRLQHAWATAVETMGIILESALKSSEGPEKWLKFFEVTGSAFAHLEKQNPVPGYADLTETKTYKEVARQSVMLNVQEKLSYYGGALEAIQQGRTRGSYYLLVLYPEKQKIEIRPYAKERFDVATADYQEEERIARGGGQQQVVLVATESIAALKNAYPNFFLDTNRFLLILREIIDLAGH